MAGLILNALGGLMLLVLLAVMALILRQWYREFTVAPIRWPRSWKGWKTLFWLFLHRCPFHHSKLLEDPWTGGDTLFCFKCDGVAMWPGDAIVALRGNHFAHEKHKAESTIEPRPFARA